jgi:heme/copper-type cytochrome/quinol oxidase subunit 2
MNSEALTHQELLTVTIAITGIVLLVTVIGFIVFVRWGRRDHQSSAKQIEQARLRAEWLVEKESAAKAESTPET